MENYYDGQHGHGTRSDAYESSGPKYDLDAVAAKSGHTWNEFHTRSSGMMFALGAASSYPDLSPYYGKKVGTALSFKKANTYAIFQDLMIVERYDPTYISKRVAHGITDVPIQVNYDNAKPFAFGFCT